MPRALAQLTVRRVDYATKLGKRSASLRDERADHPDGQDNHQPQRNEHWELKGAAAQGPDREGHERGAQRENQDAEEEQHELVGLHRSR